MKFIGAFSALALSWGLGAMLYPTAPLFFVILVEGGATGLGLVLGSIADRYPQESKND